MAPRTPLLLLVVFCLCGLQEAQEAAPPQLARCSGGLCVFLHSVDFRGAEESCTNFNGWLMESRSKDYKVLASLLEAGSEKYWISSGPGPEPGPGPGPGPGANCLAALLTWGHILEAAVPCRDKLKGFVCRYKSDEVCTALSGDAQYTINTTARFQVLSSDSFPPGTVAQVGAARHPDSRHLCLYVWNRAPWNCEVLGGGCEHGCEGSTCTCPAAHALHPNGLSCVGGEPPLVGCGEPPLVGCGGGEPPQVECGVGYEPAAGGTSCVDVNECEEDVCTAEGQECVNEPGEYRCACAHGFEEEDGACVNVSICLSCEQNLCVKVNGVFRCACMEGFTVVPEDPTKCRQSCSGPACPALCRHDPQLEERDMQQCTCPHGYIVDISDGTASCVDIDECEQQDMCDHRCENTFGSFRCACEDGFRLEVGDRCVPAEREEEDSSEPPPLLPHPPQSLHPDPLPSYIKTGSILGITVFLVLCVVLLGLLVQTMTRRCGRFDLTSIKQPDVDMFYLQQVRTETYKRLSFDKHSVTDSLRL